MKYPGCMIFWVSPILGVILGFIGVYLYLNGFFATWHLVGNPGEQIVRVIGMKDIEKVLVATETGKLYSFKIYPASDRILLTQISWSVEQDDHVIRSPEPERDAGFITLPPLFQVKQSYKFSYFSEQTGEIKFAIDPGGKIWMWSHRVGGLSGLFYLYIPAGGFFAGILVALVLSLVSWIKSVET